MEFKRDWGLRYKRLSAMTEAALKPMFVEDTGRVMIDSGDHFGRQFQARRRNPPEKQPYATMKAEVQKHKDPKTGKESRDLWIDGRINCMWFLADNLRYSASMTRRFRAFAEQPEKEGLCWLELMEEFAGARPGASGLYGDGPPIVNYTYNFQTLLDQDYQYCYWEEVVGKVPDTYWDQKTNAVITVEGKTRDIKAKYFLVQIHGGCDARWGFTAPRCFAAHGDSETTVLFGGTDASLCGKKTGSIWHTDDGGSHWYWDHSTEATEAATKNGIEIKSRLDDYPVLEVAELRRQKKRVSDVRGRGVVLVGKKGTLYCPITGHELQLS